MIHAILGSDRRQHHPRNCRRNIQCVHALSHFPVYRQTGCRTTGTFQEQQKHRVSSPGCIIDSCSFTYDSREPYRAGSTIVSPTSKSASSLYPDRPVVPTIVSLAAFIQHLKHFPSALSPP
mmetsp:Transcript_45753/g.76209  ORF Transcript_45753/g.76209 Transcript_45753/m.76209 type:complete len:121 (+) Transcript_45753:1373-1735(+)